MFRCGILQNNLVMIGMRLESSGIFTYSTLYLIATGGTWWDQRHDASLSTTRVLGVGGIDRAASVTASLHQGTIQISANLYHNPEYLLSRIEWIVLISSAS